MQVIAQKESKNIHGGNKDAEKKVFHDLFVISLSEYGPNMTGSHDISGLLVFL
jgi:hypothetical protein